MSIWTRTRNLSGCNAVSQQTTQPRVLSEVVVIFFNSDVVKLQMGNFWIASLLYSVSYILLVLPLPFISLKKHFWYQVFICHMSCSTFRPFAQYCLYLYRTHHTATN